jgi:predicted N-acetyltransferase YhbS
VRLGELAHRVGAQRRQPDPGRHGRQLAEHDPQRVVGHVAECGDRQRRHAVHAAPAQPQHVERALVGPVHVLEHEHRPGIGAQLTQ